MAKIKTKFVCQECGYETPKWLGKCPSCGEWNTFVEEKEYKESDTKNQRGISKGKIEKISDITSTKKDRITTGNREMDRVLGGGIIKSSLILVGGDPGIGKSTLLLQVANNASKQNLKVLYVSGEESGEQIKIRADRLGVSSGELYVLSETNIDFIKEFVEKENPDLLILDSIQTMYCPEISSAPGSVSQVREVTSIVLRMTKTREMATFIVGHVTKSGSIAGPRVLEHMVDTVLYFEGDRHLSFRILRAVKN
ncbi:MAG: DNA repair protein RadA, partial [Tissierellia bacterium]|nr:DNA repair protein RadA [Tissierellia bacterium]